MIAKGLQFSKTMTAYKWEFGSDDELVQFRCSWRLNRNVIDCGCVNGISCSEIMNRSVINKFVNTGFEIKNNCVYRHC